MNLLQEAELREAKRKLYSLLLKKPVEELTNSEIESMFQLPFDKQIQELFDEHRT